MAFNIEISDTVRTQVKFTAKDDKGIDKVSTFSFLADRLTGEEVEENMARVGRVYTDFLALIVREWEGVRDGSGTPIEYSEEALRKICRMPGLSQLMANAYSNAIVVKEKN